MVELLRKIKLRGVRRVGWLFTYAAAVYNVVRMRNLVETASMSRQGPALRTVAHSGPPR